MFWYLVKEWNVENKCDSWFIVWCGTRKFDLLLKCYCWYEVLWLSMEFKIGKKLVVEKCGVLGCIATRFGFHVIFVFPLKYNCFIFILWFKIFFCVLFVFILWNTNVVNISYGWNHIIGGAKNVVTLYCFIGVLQYYHVWTQPW